jgi:hypothetical protein
MDHINTYIWKFLYWITFSHKEEILRVLKPQNNKLINMSDIQQTKTNSQEHNPSSEAKDRTAAQETLFLSALNVELPCLHDSRRRQSCSSRVLPFSSPSLSTAVKHIQLHIMDEKKFV